MLDQPEFWVAVAFVVFIGFALRPASKKIAIMLDQHREKIKHQLEESHQLHEQARELLADYKQRHLKAMSDIHDIKNLAEDEVLRMKERLYADLEETMKRREAMINERLIQLQQQAIDEIKSQVTSYALAATKAVLEKSLDEQQQRAFAEKNIDQIRQSLS